MLRLRVLGGASLEIAGHRIDGPASQQRRLALLTVLAAAGSRGITRDTLLALLWPESPQERARHALSQWLFLMRRDLKIDDLISGSATLYLNPQRISSDLAEFDTAVASGDDDAAARAYGGPLLEGFFLSDAQEFEQCLDRERDRRHHEACGVFERLAHDAESDRPAEAITWWRRLTSLDPLNGPATLRLLQLLVASGDPVAALAHAKRHEALLRRELDVSPSGELVRVVDAARAALAPSSSATNAGAGTSVAEPSREPYLTFVREHLAPDYVVDSIAARTSLATVFRARATSDHTPYTLKVFLPDLMARTNRERFLADLRAAMALSHAHIDAPVRIESVDGIVFAASPGTPAPSLRERMEREDRLDVDVVARTAREMADALAYAHARGIVHGDLTPRRIVMNESGIRIGDFGLMPALTASLVGTAHDSATALGTPAYMCPELLRGDAPLTPEGDMYSMGCILFHLLTGAPPHAGSNARAIITNRLREPAPSVRDSRPDVSVVMGDLVQRLLAPVSHERPSAADVHRALLAMAN